MNAIEVLNKFNVELQQQRLTKGGTEILALCPFHTEKSPSFNLNVEKCVYKCFGCQAAGYIYDVVEACTNLNRDEIKAALKGQLPRHYQKRTPERTRNRYLSDMEIDALTKYSDGFHTLLKNQHGLSIDGLRDVEPYQKYLTVERGLSWEAIDYFKFGANALRNYNRYFVDHTRQAFRPSKANSWDLLHNLNLYTRSNGDYYWKPAIIIPYRYDGQTFYMNARILPQEVNGGPKYMGMSGIAREMLFNEAALDEFDRLFVVEGEFNAAKMWDSGFRNVVSFGGKNQMNDAIAGKFYGRDVVLYYDTDEGDPEFKTRQEAVKMLQGVARNISYFELPCGIDPNDYLKAHCREKFEDEILSQIATVDPGDEFSPDEYREIPESERREVITLSEAQAINMGFIEEISKNFPGYAGKKILNNMPIGTAKTTGAVNLLNSSKNNPALILTPTHYLATEYDDEIDFDRLTIHLKGRGHPDIDCPYAATGDYYASRGFALYFKMAYCMGTCEKSEDCIHRQLLEAARTAPVLIAVHSHGQLKDFFTSPYYGNNRRSLIVIDEEADLVRNEYFTKETIAYNRDILSRASGTLLAVKDGMNITEEQRAGIAANDLVGILTRMEAARLKRTGYKPELRPYTKKEAYQIDRAICSHVKGAGIRWNSKNMLHDLIYVVNNGLEFGYDGDRDALFYTWRAQFPDNACVLFLTGTTPKRYLERTLDIKIDTEIGAQYYVKRENLNTIQLLNVTGGRQRVLRDKQLQENIRTFFRLALQKHKDDRIIILTSQGSGIRDADTEGTAKQRIIELLNPVAWANSRELVAVTTKDLEKGNLEVLDKRWEIPTIHFGIQGTNVFADYEVLIEINAHYYYPKAITEGVLRNFGVDISSEKPVKKQSPFRTLDTEYLVERYTYGIDEVDLFIEATQQADLIQAEGRILRGEDTPKTIYRLHNVNVEPYADQVYKSWASLLKGEFGYAEISGKMAEVLNWITENTKPGDEFTTRVICEAVGGYVHDINKRYMSQLQEAGHIKNTASGKGIVTRWVKLN